MSAVFRFNNIGIHTYAKTKKSQLPVKKSGHISKTSNQLIGPGDLQKSGNGLQNDRRKNGNAVLLE